MASLPRPRCGSGFWWRMAAALATTGVATVGGAVAFVRLSAARHLYAETEVPPAPVALVLGAQVHPDGTPSGFLAARLELARRLRAAGKVRMVLVSGDGEAPEYDEPAAMRDYLIRAGVSEADIMVDPGGVDTYSSCLRAAQVYGVRELIVVTQDYHLHRAVATCRRLGLRASGVGDTSMRGLREPWVRGWVRDQVACVKTVLDLARRRSGGDPAAPRALARSTAGLEVRP